MANSNLNQYFDNDGLSAPHSSPGQQGEQTIFNDAVRRCRIRPQSLAAYGKCPKFARLSLRSTPSSLCIIRSLTIISARNLFFPRLP